MIEDKNVIELSEFDIEAVSGGHFLTGFFDWVSNHTSGLVINVFGWEISDGIPNKYQD